MIKIPVEAVYGIIAIAGGIARYLNSFTAGQPFSLGVLFASAFVSGFSGYMFAIIGISMNLPSPILFMMAGVGGFSGDQTMKFLLEYLERKID